MTLTGAPEYDEGPEQHDRHGHVGAPTAWAGQRNAPDHERPGFGGQGDLLAAPQRIGHHRDQDEANPLPPPSPEAAAQAQALPCQPGAAHQDRE